MKVDIRAEAARFYDFNPDTIVDIQFYRDRIPSPNTKVLELGCGTGRVILPLTKDCAYIHGVDLSEAMVAICQGKLDSAGIPTNKARVEVGDITSIRLGRTFDLITAPYRVFQNIETDSEVAALFDTVRRHLAKNGTCILNVFNPNLDPERLRVEWPTESEYFCWEVPVEDGRITHYGRNVSVDPKKLILYPNLIYRRYRGDDLIEEVTLKILMRCYYPDEFEEVIRNHGFEIINRWGGYSGEPYGVGPELVIQFGERGVRHG
jgi:SAM-dependent methyltransferase